jgi:hypothetical protein
LEGVPIRTSFLGLAWPLAGGVKVIEEGQRCAVMAPIDDPSSLREAFKVGLPASGFLRPPNSETSRTPGTGEVWCFRWNRKVYGLVADPTPIGEAEKRMAFISIIPVKPNPRGCPA